MATMRDLLTRARNLPSLCDPECEGRCRECPQDVVDELIAALQTAAPVGEPTPAPADLVALRHALWNLAGTIVAIVDGGDANQRELACTETSPLTDAARDAIERFNLSNETAPAWTPTPAATPAPDEEVCARCAGPVVDTPEHQSCVWPCGCAFCGACRPHIHDVAAPPASGDVPPLVTRQQLEHIEWSGGGHPKGDSCPACAHCEIDGHASDCWLARALTAPATGRTLKGSDQ